MNIRSVQYFKEWFSLVLEWQFRSSYLEQRTNLEKCSHHFPLEILQLRISYSAYQFWILKFSANTRKRKLYAILEDCSYVTRLLVNIPFWMYYFQVLFHTNGYIQSIPLSILRFPMVFTYVVYKVLQYLIPHGQFGLVRLEFTRLFTMITAMSTTSVWNICSHNLQLCGESVPLESLQDDTCPVCMETLDHPVRLECKHVFCEECISQWLETESTCPICRSAVEKGEEWIHSNGSLMSRFLWY